MTFRDPEIAVLAPALVSGTKRCRSQLDDPTPAELAFAPMPGRHSAAAVLLHHAEVETAWTFLDLFEGSDDLLNERFPEFGPDWHKGGRWPDLDGITLEEIYRRSDATRREVLERLATIEDAGMLTPDGNTARWVVNHLIGHEAYHYGQAALLIELARARR